MSLDLAYSNDLKRLVTPEEAYEFFWSEIIKDKRAFSCPSPFCDAQITCCNIDKEFHDMKQHEHFRVYGYHSYQCEISNKTIKNPVYSDKNTIASRKTTIAKCLIDEFITSRPRSYYTGKTRTFSKIENYSLYKYKLQKPITSIQNAPGISKIYSVRTILARYSRYKYNNSLDQRKIKIGLVPVNY